MDKIKIIVNPKSGKEQSIARVNALIKLMATDGYKIDLRFTTKRGDAINFAAEEDKEDLIIAVGGDGTLNEVANGMYKSCKKIPLAVFQGGTVNDFANVLKIPANPKEFYKMIKEKKTMPVDLGMAGNRVFVNVAAGGFLTEIAHQVPEELKTALGKMAYYMEGIKEVSKMSAITETKFFDISFESKEISAQEKVLIFLVANSNHIGGFKTLAPSAEVYDGYLDVLIIKGINISHLPRLLASILNGSHTNNEKVIYLKTKEIKISSKQDIVVDLDGEKSGNLPMSFKVLEKAIDIIIK